MPSRDKLSVLLAGKSRWLQAMSSSTDETRPCGKLVVLLRQLSWQGEGERVHYNFELSVAHKDAQGSHGAESGHVLIVGRGKQQGQPRKHHHHKVDAPSGTALMLGEAAAAGRGVSLSDVRDSGRDGITGARKRGDIGFAAIRGGDIVGEHDVLFASAGERIILRHVATDRAIFARGALKAALWGQGKKPGHYDMMDVLGL